MHNVIKIKQKSIGSKQKSFAIFKKIHMINPCRKEIENFKEQNSSNNNTNNGDKNCCHPNFNLDFLSFFRWIWPKCPINASVPFTMKQAKGLKCYEKKGKVQIKILHPWRHPFNKFTLLKYSPEVPGLSWGISYWEWEGIISHCFKIFF